MRRQPTLAAHRGINPVASASASSQPINERKLKIQNVRRKETRNGFNHPYPDCCRRAFRRRARHSRSASPHTGQVVLPCGQDMKHRRFGGMCNRQQLHHMHGSSSLFTSSKFTSSKFRGEETRNGSNHNHPGCCRTAFCYRTGRSRSASPHSGQVVRHSPFGSRRPAISRYPLATLLVPLVAGLAPGAKSAWLRGYESGKTELFSRTGIRRAPFVPGQV
jgi:hypothetical protein